MKKIIPLVLAGMSGLMCLAQTPSTAKQMMMEDAMTFAKALNVPLASTSTIWTELFFSDGNTVSSNNFQLVKGNSPYTTSVEFTVSSNGLEVAHGIMYERTSFEDARNAIMLSIVSCNMMVEHLVEWHKLYGTGVGDFRLGRTQFDKTANMLVDDYSVLHFVRGAKGVSLFGKDGTDVRPIAETLDALLTKPPN